MGYSTFPTCNCTFAVAGSVDIDGTVPGAVTPDYVRALLSDFYGAVQNHGCGTTVAPLSFLRIFFLQIVPTNTTPPSRRISFVVEVLAAACTDARVGSECAFNALVHCFDFPEASRFAGKTIMCAGLTLRETDRSPCGFTLNCAAAHEELLRPVAEASDNTWVFILLIIAAVLVLAVGIVFVVRHLGLHKKSGFSFRDAGKYTMYFTAEGKVEDEELQLQQKKAAAEDESIDSAKAEEARMMVALQQGQKAIALGRRYEKGSAFSSDDQLLRDTIVASAPTPAAAAASSGASNHNHIEPPRRKSVNRDNQTAVVDIPPPTDASKFVLPAANHAAPAAANPEPEPEYLPPPGMEEDLGTRERALTFSAI